MMLASKEQCVSTVLKSFATQNKVANSTLRIRDTDLLTTAKLCAEIVLEAANYVRQFWGDASST